MSSRAAGLALGYIADLLVGDPRRGHPVALFGRAASAVESRSYQDSRMRGVLFTALAVGVPLVAGVLVETSTPSRPVVRVATTAAATWAVLGGTSLAAEGTTMARLLAAEDLPAARRRLSHLCSRDPAGLDASGLARASVESVAENTSDAVTAPVFWGAVLGVPGLLGYRAANTLDAMVGYRNDRYRRFGWASARLDDLLNLVPARITALATVALAPAVGGSPAEAWRIWRRDAPTHPSPNAGPVEASAAGALGVRLGGANTYDGQVEDRGTLGDGAPADVADLPRAVHLSRIVGHACAAASVVLAVAAERATSRRGGRA